MRAAMVAVVLVLGMGTAAAETVLVGRVTDLLGKPVAGARVEVLAAGADTQTAVTDGDGNYRFVVVGDRAIEVVVGDTRRTIPQAQLRDGGTGRLDLQVETADGEIVRIIDRKPPAVPPKPAKDYSRVPPPYSDVAIERDAWSKAWLVLDIAETGKVLRVKLVKRPGFELDAIAVREAMKLVFEPARDEHGRPMRTQILWCLEWPAHGWLAAMDHATLLPSATYALSPIERPPGYGTPGTVGRVPCADAGEPLDLDSAYPTYRDCSRPNLAKLAYLPWLDGTQPIPPEPPQFAPKPEPPLHLTAASYIPQVAASTVTAGLTAAWVVTFLKYRKYAARVSGTARADGEIFVDVEEHARNRESFLRWQKLTVVTAMAAIASAGLTTSLWFRHQRRADFSVQPEPSGASVSLGGRF